MASSLKILLIDDDELVVSSIAGQLELHGHEIEIACNGRQGIRRFAEDQFDVIVTDILMPEMDGLELLRELRTQNPSIPIIAMTGGGSRSYQAAGGHTVDYAQMAERLGATDSIRKPFSARDLLALIEGVTGKD